MCWRTSAPQVPSVSFKLTVLVFSAHWTIKENVHHGLLNYCSVAANSACQEMFHMENSNDLRGIYKLKVFLKRNAGFSGLEIQIIWLSEYRRRQKQCLGHRVVWPLSTGPIRRKQKSVLVKQKYQSFRLLCWPNRRSLWVTAASAHCCKYEDSLS